MSAAFIGKVGDDAFGRHLREVLADVGVDTRGMRLDLDVRTTMAFIAKPDADSAEYVFYRNPGADIMLRADELDSSLLGTAGAFHFGSLSLTDEPSRSATMAAIGLARKGGALISFDVNFRPSLWPGRRQAEERIAEVVPQADLLKVNDDELRLLTGCDNLETGTRQLLALGPRLIVVTLGPDGSYFRIAEGGDRVAPFRVEAVDAVGCGDAFIAAVLCRLVKGGDWRRELTVEKLRGHLCYGNAVGALTATKQGVIPSLPSVEEVEQFLALNRQASVGRQRA